MESVTISKKEYEKLKSYEEDLSNPNFEGYYYPTKEELKELEDAKNSEDISEEDFFKEFNFKP